MGTATGLMLRGVAGRRAIIDVGLGRDSVFDLSTPPWL